MHGGWYICAQKLKIQREIYQIKPLSMCVAGLWQEQMETPTLKTCKVEEDLRPWPGKTLQTLFSIQLSP